MSSNNLSTGTWASLSEGCPLRCAVEGSDFAVLMIGDDAQSIELLLNAEGVRKLATVGTRAVAEMDALFEQEASRGVVASTIDARGVRS